MFQLPGIVIALITIILWFVVSLLIRRLNNTLLNMSCFTYYWTTFIILTGFWEIIYLSNYKYIAQDLAQELINTHTHVWFNNYNLNYILPWKFSGIFYAEYGAYADREYMSMKDNWSHLIEGSHCIFVSLFLILALVCALWKGLDSEHYTYSLAFAMGTQFMNSLLYMGEYSIQTYDSHSVNYNTDDFPLGEAWSKRPFMYVNILWMILPAIVTYMHLTRTYDTRFNASYYGRPKTTECDIWSYCIPNKKQKNYSINNGMETNPLLDI